MTMSKVEEENTTTDKHSTTDTSSVLYQEEYTTPFWPALVVVFPLLPLFWTYHVRITKETLDFGYSTPLTRKVANRSAVTDATVLAHVHGLRQWGGWGIRMRLDKPWSGETGYIAQNGPAVRVTLRHHGNADKTSVYVFNCAEPQKVCDLLMNKNDTQEPSKGRGDETATIHSSVAGE